MNNKNLKNIYLTIAYDGTDYCGFQSQRGTGLATIQQTLEDGLSRLTGATTEVIGSGRTDSGVHAWGQVVNFLTESTIQPERYKLAMKAHLPETILVKESKEVALDFHSRFDATNKTYLYYFYCNRQMSPFHLRYAYHVPYKVNLVEMQQAATFFEGIHDFRGFCPANTPTENFVREIYECSLSIEPPLVTLKISGNGFLWNMVRIIAGTILKVGEGKIRALDIPVLIGSGQRKQAGKTMPPHGLYLYEVNY